MKKICMLLLAFLAVNTAYAYDDLFRWGITGGGNISKAEGDGPGFLDSGWDFDTSGGYFVGLTVKIGLPMTGFGLDGSFYYSQEMVDISSGGSRVTDKLRYFTIPVHLRYDLEVPAADNLIVPFGFVGPQCSFALNDFDWYALYSKDLLSSMAVHDPQYNETADQIWKLDLGFGVVLCGHVQIAYTYNVPLNNAFRFKTIYNDASENFKLGCHRIGLTYFF